MEHNLEKINRYSCTTSIQTKQNTQAEEAYWKQGGGGMSQ